MKSLGVLLGLFFALPVLLIGAWILKVLAIRFAKIENATFKNSFVVVLVSGVLIFILMSPIGLEEFMELGILGVITFLTIVQTLSYTVGGKYVWKTTFQKAFKAILIPMVVQTILFAVFLNLMNGMM
jgi:hypothetical protein